MIRSQCPRGFQIPPALLVIACSQAAAKEPERSKAIVRREPIVLGPTKYSSARSTFAGDASAESAA